MSKGGARAAGLSALTAIREGVASDAGSDTKGQEMFASMRRYRLERGTMADLSRAIDEDFAEQLSGQPGFVSYEFIDCGLGEFMTFSVFVALEQAEASRELARGWAAAHRDAFEFPRIEAAHGEIVVGRRAADMLEDSHVGAPPKSAAIRRFRVGAGSVAELMGKLDGAFADRFEAMEGFAAWHVFDCGDGEILWISLVRDHEVAAETDERVHQFVSEDLREFGLERRTALQGELIVSRARTELLETARA